MEYIDISKKKTKDEEATCVIDFMLASNIYKNNLEKLVNELITLKLGSTDTSRNAVIIALCHLIKNQKSRDKIRTEIDTCLTKHGVDSVMKLDHQMIKPVNMPFTNQVLKESMRFNPPVPCSDEYKITRDCKLANFEL